MTLENFLIKIKERMLVCTRCKYTWIQKSIRKKPKTCPSCNSPYYNKPRQKDIKKLMLTQKIEF